MFHDKCYRKIVKRNEEIVEIKVSKRSPTSKLPPPATEIGKYAIVNFSSES